ncbi:coenzyme F420-0:L-glutamate ligase [Nocardioides sp. AE5]|uniref:coenzyme F420-0:L-glutamate ligase n=1 Tax=Nocardioides sp. AE5 TaxID=2962573 RepID=UPI002881FC2E|nr:coenzyme F420-0:L-glutamate ligase [Nocardioides sp. AE5]MDT0201892.1 coenzyme F420-0:L-glutamate ligase [Nocardioides sp. AE5]
MTSLRVVAPDGVGEISEGDDLGQVLLAACRDAGVELADGDVVTITSKVVSKAEGRQRTGDRESAIAGESVRVVARRGPTTIVRNHLGLTMAAAGIDASNVAAGQFLLLPLDPDATARRVRQDVLAGTGRNVAVLVTDTAGRPWRNGQTDIAIGAAGLVVLEEFAGRIDDYGNPLAVTAPAVADELAGLSELASGKLGGRPFTVISGRADLVLPPGEHGSGAGALVREDGADMFGLGSREAVVRALAGTDGAIFGAPAVAADLHAAAVDVFGPAEVIDGPGGAARVVVRGVSEPSAYAARALAHAFGWHVRVTTAAVAGTVDVSFLPPTP